MFISYGDVNDYLSHREEIIFQFMQFLGIDTRGKMIIRGNNIKPHIDGTDVHFNVSHTEKQYFIVVSRDEVGIDAEVVNPTILSIAELVHPIEKNMMLKKKSAIINTMVWTSKESYLKYKGIGLIGRLDSFYSNWNEGLVYDGNRVAAKISFFLLDNTVIALTSSKQNNLNLVTFYGRDEIS